MSAKENTQESPLPGTPEWDQAVLAEMENPGKVEDAPETPADKEIPPEPEKKEPEPPADDRIAQLEKNQQIAEKRVKDTQAAFTKTRATNKALRQRIAELEKAQKALEVERHKATAPDPDEDLEGFLKHRDKLQELEKVTPVVEDEDDDVVVEPETQLTEAQQSWYEAVTEGCQESGVDLETAWQDAKFQERANKLRESLGGKWGNPAVATAKLVALKQTMDNEAAAASDEAARKTRNLADQDIPVGGGSPSGAPTTYSEKDLLKKIEKMSMAELDDIDALNAELAKLR